MIIVDTSALLAGYDAKAPHHSACLRVFAHDQRRVLSPFVLAELDYLIVREKGTQAERRMLNDVARGAFDLEPFNAEDIADATRIIDRYQDLEIGLADASLVVLAQRYQCLDLLTLDQRHFRAITGPGGKPFRILPFVA